MSPAPSRELAISTWPGFVEEVEREVFPRYRAHELSFDRTSLHGRLHIARCLVFAEFMSRFYAERGAAVDLLAVRTAVAFHDAAREDNGADLWEPQSASLCTRYLVERGRPPEYADRVGQLIVKKRTTGDALHESLVTDADVLDIMRCCGGIRGFKRKYLRFPIDLPSLRAPSPPLDVREQLIAEAWQLVQHCDREQRQAYLSSEHPLRRLLDVLSTHRSAFPLLATVGTLA